MVFNQAQRYNQYIYIFKKFGRLSYLVYKNSFFIDKRISMILNNINRFSNEAK